LNQFLLARCNSLCSANS